MKTVTLDEIVYRNRRVDEREPLINRLLRKVGIVTASEAHERVAEVYEWFARHRRAAGDEEGARYYAAHATVIRREMVRR